MVFNREASINRDIGIGLIDKSETVTSRIKEGFEILVVDGNKVNRHRVSRLVLTNMLQSTGGMNIDSAKNGEQVPSFTSNKSYDLIPMDKFMPKMDGLDATRRIRSDFDSVCKHSPISFLSAGVERHDYCGVWCMDAGANGFLPKPSGLLSSLKMWKRLWFLAYLTSIVGRNYYPNEKKKTWVVFLYRWNVLCF